MLTNLGAAPQQNRDIQPVASRQLRICVDIDPLHRRQVDPGLGGKGCQRLFELFAEAATLPGQQLQWDQAIQDGRIRRWP